MIKQEQQQQQVKQDPEQSMMVTLLQMHLTQQQTNAQLLQLHQKNDSRFAANEAWLEKLEGRHGSIEYLRPVHPLESDPAPAPAPAPALQRPHRRPQRRSERYTLDEDARILQYLIQHNKIGRASNATVWEEARADDTVLARRTAVSLTQRFRRYIW